ncbi:MAG: hypothetical protein QOJ69_1805 [Actinomycetota bacterium]|nr:hypothetical protein [Actinomycetota bacterium]
MSSPASPVPGPTGAGVATGGPGKAGPASPPSSAATGGPSGSVGDQATPTGSKQQAAPSGSKQQASGPSSTGQPAPATAAQASPPTSAKPAVTETTQPSGLARQPSVEAEVLSLTNRDRAANGRDALSRDGCMDGKASDWARHMAATKTMSHSGQGGPWVTGCRGASAAWADNVGNGIPCSASEMQGWWMGSPGHRTNLLGAGYVAAGIGVWADATGHCWFQVLFGS